MPIPGTPPPDSLREQALGSIADSLPFPGEAEGAGILADPPRGHKAKNLRVAGLGLARAPAAAQGQRGRAGERRAGSEAGAAALTSRHGKGPRPGGRPIGRNFCHSTVVRPGPGLCSVTREAWPRGRAGGRADGRRRRFLHPEAGASAADRRRRTSRSGRGAGG